LLSNVVISPFLLKERFQVSDLFGIFLCIVGAVTVVFASRDSDVRLGPDGLLHAIMRKEFVAYSITACALGAVLASMSRTKWGERFVLIDIGVCAIFGESQALPRLACR
jgi:drug/metabolite transporter (DMT)-like permease